MMQKHSLSTNQNESGQSLVEMALTLIVLLLLLASAIDLGIALYSYVTIRDAAQEGALYGSVAYGIQDNSDLATAAIIDRVETASTSPIDLASELEETSGSFTEGISLFLVTPATAPDGTQINSGDDLSEACEGNSAQLLVEVRYIYRPITPMVPNLLGIAEIPLTARVTNAILQPHCN